MQRRDGRGMWFGRILLAGLAAGAASTLTAVDAARAGDAPAQAAPPAPAPAQPGAPAAAPAPLFQNPAHRVVRMTGRMPFLGQEEPLDADVTIEFTLFTSPVGGRPLWTETRKVAIRANMVDVALGEVVPLPDIVFTATFRFIGFKIDDGPELTPRWPIESLVWAGDPDAVTAGNAKGLAAPKAGATPETAPAPAAPTADGRPATVALPGTSARMEPSTRSGASYVEAARDAERTGRRLPTLEEWFAARRAGAAAGFRDMNGHYEWVQPFIYTAQAFPEGIASYSRRKINGCSGEELSPETNAYAYRCVEEAPAAAPPPAGGPGKAPPGPAKAP